MVNKQTLFELAYTPEELAKLQEFSSTTPPITETYNETTRPSRDELLSNIEKALLKSKKKYYSNVNTPLTNVGELQTKKLKDVNFAEYHAQTIPDKGITVNYKTKTITVTKDVTDKQLREYMNLYNQTSYFKVEVKKDKVKRQTKKKVKPSSLILNLIQKG